MITVTDFIISQIKKSLQNIKEKQSLFSEKQKKILSIKLGKNVLIILQEAYVVLYPDKGKDL